MTVEEEACKSLTFNPVSNMSYPRLQVLYGLQGARAKYEQIQVSFDNEHLLCAKMTADLTVSTDECQRVKAKLAELETLHGQTVLEQEKLVTSLQEQLHILRGSHSEVNEDLIAKDLQVSTGQLHSMSCRLQIDWTVAFKCQPV